VRDKPKLDVDTLVRLVLLLDVLEAEVKGLSLAELAWSGELLGEGEEFVVVASVKEPRECRAREGRDELGCSALRLRICGEAGRGRERTALLGGIRHEEEVLAVS
jgi:hypothetical protein